MNIYRYTKIQALILLMLLLFSSVSYGMMITGSVSVHEKVKNLVSSGKGPIAVTEKSLLLIDPATTETQKITVTDYEIEHVAADSSISSLAVLGDDEENIHIVDLITGRVNKLTDTENVSALCIHPKMDILITASHKDEYLNMINLQSLDRAGRLGFKKNVTGLWCFPEEGLILAAITSESKKENNDKDTDRDEEKEDKDHDAKKRRKRYENKKDNEKDDDSNEATALFLLNLINGEVINKAPIQGDIKAVSIDHSSSIAAILSDDGSILMLVPESMSIRPLASLKNIGDIELTDDMLLVTDRKSGSLLSLNASTGKTMDETYIGEGIRDITAMPGYILVSFRGGIKILKTETAHLSINSLTPSAALAGSGDIEVTVRGSGFLDGAAARLDNNGLSTSFISETELKVLIPSLHTGSASYSNITVLNPDGGESGPLVFTIENPLPQINSIAPSAIKAGLPDTVITINGNGFVSTSAVIFDGNIINSGPTAESNAAAAVPSAILQNPGEHLLYVSNPAPGGGDSNLISFSVLNPVDVSINSHINGETVTSPLIEISGTASSTTPIASVDINGVAAALSGDLFNASIALSVGVNTLTATAADSYGNLSAYSIDLIRAVKGKIAGTVTALSTGYPLPAASVSITDSAGIFHKTITANNGTFVLNDMESGGYTGNIIKDGYLSYQFSGNIDINQEINIGAALEPILPVITNLSILNITAETAEITWITDQPAESLIDYGLTAIYSDAVADPVMTTDHAVTLTGLSPETTYHLRASSINSYGFPSSSGDYSFTTPAVSPTISLDLTFPADGAFLSQPDTVVSGTIFNETGFETGVTVNGKTAVVENGEFIINDIQLAEGENVISVNALDTSGNTASAFITVTADTTLPYVALNSNIESGIAPLTAYFSINTAIPNSVSTYQIDYEGDGVVDYTGATFDNISFTYNVEGVYYPEVTVTDSLGNSYQDTITVVVQNETEIDMLLQGKWDNMVNALMIGETELALNDFIEESKDRYRNTYLELSTDQINSIFSGIVEFKIYSLSENVAQCGVLRQESSGTYSYPVTFVKDENGIWKIMGF